MTDGPVDGLPDTDLEGCQIERHCHRPRSSRQEDTLTDDGLRRACHRPAGWGTSHPGSGACKLHGGSSRNGTVNAQRELARRAVQTYGLPVDITPEQALLDGVKRSAGHVMWLGMMVSGLDTDELGWGIDEETVAPGVVSDDGTAITNEVTSKYRAKTNIYVDLYNKERDRLMRYSEAAVKAGVSERLVTLYENVYEQIAEQFTEILNGVLDRLELSEDQRRDVPAAVVHVIQGITPEDVTP